MGFMVLRVRPNPAQFPTNNLYSPLDNTHLYILYQACAVCGAPSAIAGGGTAFLPRNRGGMKCISRTILKLDGPSVSLLIAGKLILSTPNQASEFSPKSERTNLIPISSFAKCLTVIGDIL